MREPTLSQGGEMVELSLLFWNVAGKDLRHRVARLTTSRAADLVVLAENATPGHDLVAALHSGAAQYQFAADRQSKIAIFSRLPADAVRTLQTDSAGRVTFRRVSLAGTQE